MPQKTGCGRLGRIDQEVPVGPPQDSHIGLDVAFAVEQYGVAASSGIETFNVVAHLTLKELGCVGTGDRNCSAVGPQQATLLAKLAVLGIKIRAHSGGHAPILRRGRSRYASGVPFASDFQEVLDSLPADWTDLVLDLRIDDESRYIDGSVLVSLVNAQPYSQAEWHWRIPVAHSFGHAAAPETVAGVLANLDRQGFTGELRLGDVREGRSEVVQMWGRPESVREEFRTRRSI